MRKINAEIVQARDDFWKNGHTDASEKDDKKTEVQDDNFGKEEKTKDNSISVVNEGDVPLRRIRRSSARIRSTAK